MRQLKTVLLASLFIACLFTIYSFTKAPAKRLTSKVNKAVAAFGNAQVSGGGTTMEDGAKSTFVFNAVQQKDGSVNGHLVYTYRGSYGDLSIHVDITCMTITGNQATLSGVITSVNPKEYASLIGRPAAFRVQDKGQGKSASPDLVSDIIVGDQASCQGNYQTYLPIDGNIDIKE